MKLNIRERLSQYRRTIEISRKPDREEFVNAAKITGSGIALIGAIGLIIFLIYYLTIGGLTGA
jgi:protein transport protein SEC61 subunit gamma-like protein